jgi:hypothetical protein
LMLNGQYISYIHENKIHKQLVSRNVNENK